MAKWEKGSRTKRRPLSLRHEQLVDTYFGAANFNKTAALRMCGYRHPEKYTRLFDHPAVVAEVERRHRDTKERYEVTYERTRDEIARVAFSNVFDFAQPEFDNKGKPTGELLFDFSNLSAVQAAAIGEITIETYQEGKGKDAVPVKRVRVKPWNKLAALEQLMRHAGLSRDKADKALANLADRIMAGRKRVGDQDAASDK